MQNQQNIHVFISSYIYSSALRSGSQGPLAMACPVPLLSALCLSEGKEHDLVRGNVLSVSAC
jgi:hypothetical protein